jgi:hypothetical protein
LRSAAVGSWGMFAMAVNLPCRTVGAIAARCGLRCRAGCSRRCVRHKRSRALDASSCAHRTSNSHRRQDRCSCGRLAGGLRARRRVRVERPSWTAPVRQHTAGAGALRLRVSVRSPEQLPEGSSEHPRSAGHRCAAGHTAAAANRFAGPAGGAVVLASTAPVSGGAKIGECAVGIGRNEHS